ncbi:NAD-binding protein, partial [candidate division KSB1 bacterium]|nr:NAD-binding protein [candidate division KSB1 bacterium]
MRIIVIGVGEVGFNLAKILSQENHDIVVIENDQEKCVQAQEQLDVSVTHATCASAKILVEAGVKEADIVVAASDIDEVNIMASMLTRQLSGARTVARVRNPEYSNENPVISASQLVIDMMI